MSLFNQYLVYLHVDFQRNKESTKILVNSTMQKKRRRTLCPLLTSLSSFICQLQLLQGRQCLFKVRSALHWHSIGTCLVRTKPPVSFEIVIFLWCQMVSMIFVCKNIHLSSSIFVSTIFNHSIAECFVSNKSVMDTLEALLFSLLLELVGRITFLISWLLTISMCPFLMTYSGIERRSIVYLINFLIFPYSFTQEVPARAIDVANVPV